ncbi:unnamed protein product [Owenia fusiformis]|uniref:Uncharacterized protein n=1 Tax=Owenia fusiformis TaxID=6347 RepID=A0A8S4PM64_OWEFU|nr:unnamed protein product [Owenia fusiformis]
MASLEEHYKEFLTCQICFDIYDIPKSLPCLHVFCQGCLDYWISQSTDDTQFPCPICRANFSKTGGGAADYLTNFHMNSMVDALKNILTKDGADKVTIESLCDICTASGENVTAEHRCIECDEKLCQSCGKTHRHSKLTKSHQVIDFTGDELKDAQAIIEVISTKNVYCSKHKDEPVKFFCTSDNEALCQVCFVTGHASHNCEDINESAKSKLKEVAKLIELATKREKRFENSINRTSNVIKAVDKAVGKAQQDAKEDKALAQTVLDTHYGDLEGNIYELKTAKVKALQAHAENLQLLKGIAETTKLQMMSLQQHGHPVEVVNMGNYITSKVEEWSQSFDPNKGTPVDEPIGIELYPCRIQDLQLSLANLPYEDDGNEDDDLESLGESVGDSVEDAAETLDQLDDKDEKEYLGPVHRGIKCDICTNKDHLEEETREANEEVLALEGASILEVLTLGDFTLRILTLVVINLGNLILEANSHLLTLETREEEEVILGEGDQLTEGGEGDTPSNLPPLNPTTNRCLVDLNPKEGMEGRKRNKTRKVERINHWSIQPIKEIERKDETLPNKLRVL